MHRKVCTHFPFRSIGQNPFADNARRIYIIHEAYTAINLDYLIVGSDSGRIVILEYNPAKNQFEKVHQETFGKSGVRRIVPGQYLAADPKGRAVMIGM